MHFYSYILFIRKLYHTSTEYSYDNNSNRISKVEDGTETDYSYNELNQLIKEESKGNSIDYSYDKNGNLISKEGSNEDTTYSYNNDNKLIRTTIQQGANVTIEAYEYDYLGNRIKKTVNENDVTKYLVDTNNDLAQVIAETDDNNNLKAYYTRGLELISQERDNENYYLYDWEGNVRSLLDNSGNATDNYSYDAFGNITEKSGSTENNYYYNGEQYDSNTGFYYLRARYMNPQTGIFITMDPYSGSIFDPVSLHKYLYANANPVMNSDPTGNFSLGELEVSIDIQGILDTRTAINVIKIMKIVNNVTTAVDTVKAILNGESLENVLFTMCSGILTGYCLGKICSFKTIGKIVAKCLLIYGAISNAEELQDDLSKGDYFGALLKAVELVCGVESLGESCFTGDTLVSTKDGEKRIDEIKEGDYVYTENIETGEKELKKVLKVYVKETDTLVHLKVNGEKQRTQILYLV